MRIMKIYQRTRTGWSSDGSMTSTCMTQVNFGVYHKGWSSDGSMTSTCMTQVNSRGFGCIIRPEGPT